MRNAQIIARNKAVADSVIALRNIQDKAARELAAKRASEDSLNNALFLQRQRERALAAASDSKYIDTIANNDMLKGLSAIYFEKNSIILNQSAGLQLDQIVSTLKAQPTAVVKIYTTATADENNPDDLSDKRAGIIRRYLTAYGIPSSRIQLSFHGISISRNGCNTPNCTEAQLQENRSASYKIVIQ